MSMNWKNHIVNMSILPNYIYRSRAILINISTFFPEKILKFVWNEKKAQITKVILSRKNKMKDIIHSDGKIYYKALLIKTAYC